MPQYTCETYLQEISSKYNLIKTLKKLSSREANSYEYERLLASYYLVEVCSGLEHAAKATVKDLLMGGKKGHETLRNFLLESHYFPSVRNNEICDFLAQLDPKLKSDYQKRVKSREIADMDALYLHRQRVVHYGESSTGTLTIHDVDEKRRHAAWLIRKMETSFKKAL